MNKVDYIIVGGGYAAMFFAHQLIKAQKSFVVFADKELGGSHVSAGIINPVVLKKFTTFWKAHEQINFLHQTLQEIQNCTGDNYFINAPIHRILHDENEKNLWLKKREKEDLKDFLSSEFISLDVVNNPFETGKVNLSGRLNVKVFFDDMKTYLESTDSFITDSFDYNAVNTSENIYKNIEYKNIVFCEGIKVKKNPFFKDIPVVPNKGHQIKVSLSTPVPANITIKKKHFLFPLNDKQYFYGGTYDREHLDVQIDKKSVEQLKNGLQEIYPYHFNVDEVHYGFRPTVKDRRPILGRHPEFENFYVFNGLGARGILNGCYFSKSLFDFIENKNPLPEEVDLKRFSV